MNRTFKMALMISLAIHLLVAAVAALLSPVRSSAGQPDVPRVVELVVIAEDPAPTVAEQKSTLAAETPAPPPVAPPIPEPPKPPEKIEPPPVPPLQPKLLVTVPRETPAPIVTVVQPLPAKPPASAAPAAVTNQQLALLAPGRVAKANSTNAQSSNPVTRLAATFVAAMSGAVRVRGIPAYRKRVDPEYPVSARKRRQEGTVLLHVQLDASGHVEQARVAHSSGFTVLDDAALKAVQEWEFEAARLDARPVASEVEVPVRFRLTP